jgi:hypothetical protein
VLYLEGIFGKDILTGMEAEKEAKKAGLEIWSLGDNYVSPREWRQMKK